MFNLWNDKKGNITLKMVYEALHDMERIDLIKAIEETTKCPYANGTECVSKVLYTREQNPPILNNNNSAVFMNSATGARCVQPDNIPVNSEIRDNIHRPSMNQARAQNGETNTPAMTAQHVNPEHSRVANLELDNLTSVSDQYSSSYLPKPEWRKSAKSLTKSEDDMSKDDNSKQDNSMSLTRNDSGEKENDLANKTCAQHLNHTLNVTEEPYSDTENTDQSFENNESLDQTRPKIFTEVRYAPDMTTFGNHNQAKYGNTDKIESSKTKSCLESDGFNKEKSLDDAGKESMNSKPSNDKVKAERLNDSVTSTMKVTTLTTADNGKLQTVYDRQSPVSEASLQAENVDSFQVQSAGTQNGEETEEPVRSLKGTYDKPAVKMDDETDKPVVGVVGASPHNEVTTDDVLNHSIQTSLSSIPSASSGNRTVLELRESCLNDPDYSLEDRRLDEPDDINNSAEMKSIERKSKKTFTFLQNEDSMDDVEADNSTGIQSESSYTDTSYNNKDFDNIQSQSNDIAKNEASNVQPLQGPGESFIELTENWDSGNESQSNSLTDDGRNVNLGNDTDNSSLTQLKLANQAKNCRSDIVQETHISDTPLQQSANHICTELRGEMSHSLPYLNANNTANVELNGHSLPGHIHSSNSHTANGSVVVKEETPKGWFDRLLRLPYEFLE